MELGTGAFPCTLPGCDKRLGSVEALRLHMLSVPHPNVTSEAKEAAVDATRKRNKAGTGAFPCTLPGCDKRLRSQRALRLHIMNANMHPSVTREQRTRARVQHAAGTRSSPHCTGGFKPSLRNTAISPLVWFCPPASKLVRPRRSLCWPPAPKP